MNRLLPYRPKRPPPPPKICLDFQDFLQRPFWFIVRPLAANDWQGSPPHRTLTLEFEVANPYAPPAAQLAIVNGAVVPPQPLLITNNTTTTHGITQLQSHPIVQLDLLFAGVRQATQYLKPARFNF